MRTLQAPTVGFFTRAPRLGDKSFIAAFGGDVRAGCESGDVPALVARQNLVCEWPVRSAGACCDRRTAFAGTSRRRAPTCGARLPPAAQDVERCEACRLPRRAACDEQGRRAFPAPPAPRPFAVVTKTRSSLPR